MINNKVYIGQAVNIERRWQEHINELNENKHINKHLQRAFNRYGASNFIFSIVEECSEDKLNDREIYYIAKYKTHNPKYGYNKTYGGDGGRQTDEIRDKMSKSIKKAYADPAIHDKKSKLIKEDVLQIVEIFVTKHYSMTKLGKMFNVGTGAIASIINNQTFHIYDKEINKMLAKYNLTRADLKGMKRKANGANKLSKEEVLQIVELFITKHYSMTKLGKMFNVDMGAIRPIIDNQTFHIYDKEINAVLAKYNLTREDLKGMKIKHDTKRKLSKENVLNVIDLYLHGHTQKEIAKMYNMSETVISHLINGSSYKQYDAEIQQMIDDFYADK